ASQDAVRGFIKRWADSGAAERANYQLFLSELCDALEVPRPNPARADDKANDYVFERVVTFHYPDGTTSTGRIDLYKQGCFVLEAKQGSNREKSAAETASKPRQKTKRGTAVRGTRKWDDAMLAARGQAEQYVRALPAGEGNPPFLVVVDVGHSIDLYSDFTRSGKTYVPFPDARSHRIRLEQLADEAYRERLKLVWTDPLALDPARRSARVTRDVAARLARLAKSLEESGHAPEAVAAFLMRSIFTMFAEDVKLIPEGGFTNLLERLRERVEIFPKMVRSLWQNMNEGGFSVILERDLLRFNGGLFESADALPINAAQLDLLIEASRADWKDVEPAIFGTLLERALDPLERHKLGAHYTPRAYVERLVMPTIIEPLREEWAAAQAAAVTLAKAGRLDQAAEEVKAFHRRLCETRVLDPACGSGNFLYVTLEHMKRLEGEVLRQLEEFSEGQMRIEAGGFTVDPHQLLGIEVNPRAAAIADLVLWIGYLQWHFRTRGEAMPPEPVLKKFNNIECRDAVLAYDRVEQVVDERGEAVTRWDGRTHKKHAVTGEDVPDESARVAVLKYVNARKAEWPAADFIIGNPPFIGNKRMRFVLGDGYVKALRETQNDVPETSDFVMYWWNQAAQLVRAGKARRFGFITTNSITQTFNRKILENYLTGDAAIKLRFAVPDHPWVDSIDGAAVRIAMTVVSTDGN
ncbi:MAG TPA: DNA methyltransferase, partial [Blastocatellia bacterium]